VSCSICWRLLGAVALVPMHGTCSEAGPWVLHVLCWGKQIIKKFIIIKGRIFVIKHNAAATDQVDGECCC
jgi:hypothetical protein